MCSSSRLIFTIKCSLWKEYSSNPLGRHSVREESGDEVGVLFLCGVGGECGGEPDAPVSLCIAAAIASAIEMD